MNQSYQSICMLPYTEQRKWCKDGKRWNRIKLTHNFRTDKQKRTNSNMGGLESVERKNRWKNGEGGKKCQPFNQMYHTRRTKVVVHRWTTVNMNSPIVRRGSFFLFAKNDTPLQQPRTNQNTNDMTTTMNGDNANIICFE